MYRTVEACERETLGYIKGCFGVRKERERERKERELKSEGVERKEEEDLFPRKNNDES